MREFQRFSLSKDFDSALKLIAYAEQFENFALLDSCDNMVYDHGEFKFILGVGIQHEFVSSYENAFKNLKAFRSEHQDWVLGYFGYDLKNDVEHLNSSLTDRIGYPDCLFFIPSTLILVKTDAVFISSYEFEAKKVYNEIININLPVRKTPVQSTLISAVSKEDYISNVNRIKEHIIDGDVYELNYCQEFYSQDVELDPFLLYERVRSTAKAPFSVFFKWSHQFMISASPERFLRICNGSVYSYPIKGTILRSSDKQEDERLKDFLSKSDKNRAENVMITDLVRNDLTKYAQTGSIRVEELFKIYSFTNVHHMVSKISAQLHSDVDVLDVIKNAFPMGSMTGAPKVRSMQLIEQLESSKRGLYSGAFGYITPDNEADFNVVIRSLMFDESKKVLSIHAGGAIVYDSNPEEEYQECLQKIKGFLELLQGHSAIIK